MAKTKEEKRKAWRDYYKKNRTKYSAWSKGWRSSSQLTPEEFLKKWKADHDTKRRAKEAKKS
jgi:hypothetical protein